MSESGDQADLWDARRVSSSLHALGVRPSRGWGQNFLTSTSVIERIANLTTATRNDTIVEVGPGLGALTASLADQAGHVIAIEIDDQLAANLARTVARPNLTIISGDALTVPASAFVPSGGEYLFAANLPYSAGTAIIRRFLELEQPPRRMVVMLQREVAERMAASPPDMSLLGVAIQVYASPSIQFHVPPTAFKPKPKIESTVLVLEMHATPLLELGERDAFFAVLHAGFHQKRKQLVNTLSSGLQLPKPDIVAWLESNEIDPTRRAESLHVVEWLSLTRTRPDHG